MHGRGARALKGFVLAVFEEASHRRINSPCPCECSFPQVFAGAICGLHILAIWRIFSPPAFSFLLGYCVNTPAYPFIDESHAVDASPKKVPRHRGWKWTSFGFPCPASRRP